MNTLPQLIVNGLSKLGVIAIPLPQQRMRVEAERKPLALNRQAKMVSAAPYDPDREFVEAANAKPVMFDFTADTDHLGRKIAGYSAQLYETNGRSYRLRKISGDKSTLLEAMSIAETRFTETFADRLPPARSLRESKVYDREQYLENVALEVMNDCMAQLREGSTFASVVRNLREAAALREDDFATGSDNSSGSFGQSYYTRNRYGDGLDANSEYTPLLGGPWNKQLYLSAYLDMHARAFEAVNHNPLAHQLVKLATMFTLGRGIDHTASNTEVDELVREFVDRTSFYERLETMSTDLWWAGELFIEFNDDAPSKGLTDFRAQDPSTILDIITQPDDYRNVFYAHQQYSCLDPDTRIPLLDGTSPTIKEMSERHSATGEQFDVYSFDLAEGKIVSGRAVFAGLSGPKRCVEVELDNGETITASFDHPFLTRQGQYVNAENLQPGQSLMPLYRKPGYESVWQPQTGWEHTHKTVARAVGLDLSKPNRTESLAKVNHKVVAVRPIDGERDVYDLSVDKYHNFAVAAGVFTHNTPYTNYIKSGPSQPEAIKYIIRQIPADQFLHIKINASEYEKRGRSELFSILGWLKRLKDLMNARVIKGQLEAAFVWDIEIASGDADVETAGLQLPDPYNPGATFIHNKSLKLTPQSSAMRGSDAAPDISELKILIATGTSTPKEFIGETSRGSRSTSLAGTEPGTKNYESKQQLQMRLVYAVFDRVITNAANAGLIDLDEVLKDARTVKRLAVMDGSVNDREDAQKEFEQNKDEATKQAAQQQQQQQAALTAQGATAAPMVGVNRAQPLGGAHTLALPGAKPPAAPQPPPMVNVKSKVRESLIDSTKDSKTMSDAQKRRIKAIKASGHLARELMELSFPSIAQEDRGAKLKDLALAEAMEWLPKSVVATLAAKELNITTYDFQETWATIVEEAKNGMSIAHVYGQDNKHVPDVAIAQSIQEEDQAMTPPAGGAGFANVPVPPAVAGMKQVPTQPTNGVPPGQKPNSGDTKVNNKQAVPPPNPTAASHGYSAAANHPMSNEGIANAKKKEAAVLKRAIYTVMLREAIKPMIDMRTQLARYILDNDNAKAQFEAAVAETEAMRTNAPTD